MYLQALERTSLSLCNDTQKIAGSGTPGKHPWSVAGNEPQRRWGARTRVSRTSLTLCATEKSPGPELCDTVTLALSILEL